MITVNGREAPLGPDANPRLAAVRELLRQRAAETGLLLGDDRGERALDEAIERLLDHEVATPEPTLEECRRHYDRHPERFVRGELAYVRHILFAVTPGTPVDALRRTAEKTLQELMAHPERFGDVAAQFSNCPSGQQGGNLGQLQRGETVPEFEQAVFDGTATGILARLVNTRYGFHIVAVDRRVAGTPVPFEEVREAIADYLAETVRARALTQYVKVLAGRAQILGADLDSASTPLVR